MEKYGFVYIWYDRKYKRYYIGCRWGNENDGYICSSKWMKISYQRRSTDFKRKILMRIYTNKKELLEKEYEWLKKIKKEELGKKYYNLHNHHFNHWSANEKSKLSVSEKLKNAWNDDNRKRHSEAKLGDKNPMKREEVVKKRLETWKQKEHIAWNKGKPQSEEQKKQHSEKMKGRIAPNKGKPMSIEQKEKLSEYNKTRKWVYDPLANKNYRIHKDDDLPNGFVLGKRHKG